MANILLLEDDLTQAMQYRQWLEDLHHVVFHEVNCETAKLTLREAQIDVIITDIILRDASGEPMVSGGLTLISHAKLSVEPCPKIIAITGTNPQMALIRHAESLRIDGTLMKPIAPDQLREVLESVYAKSH